VPDAPAGRAITTDDMRTAVLCATVRHPYDARDDTIPLYAQRCHRHTENIAHATLWLLYVKQLMATS